MPWVFRPLKRAGARNCATRADGSWRPPAPAPHPQTAAKPV